MMLLDPNTAYREGTKRGTPHNILSTYGSLIKNAQVFSNAGFTGEEAAAAVKGRDSLLMHILY